MQIPNNLTRYNRIRRNKVTRVASFVSDSRTHFTIIDVQLTTEQHARSYSTLPPDRRSIHLSDSLFVRSNHLLWMLEKLGVRQSHRRRRDCFRRNLELGSVTHHQWKLPMRGFDHVQLLDHHRRSLRPCGECIAGHCLCWRDESVQEHSDPQWIAYHRASRFHLRDRSERHSTNPACNTAGDDRSECECGLLTSSQQADVSKWWMAIRRHIGKYLIRSCRHCPS